MKTVAIALQFLGTLLLIFGLVICYEVIHVSSKTFVAMFLLGTLVTMVGYFTEAYYEPAETRFAISERKRKLHYLTYVIGLSVLGLILVAFI